MSNFESTLKQCIEIYNTLEEQNPNKVYTKCIDTYLKLEGHTECPTSFYGFADPMVDLTYKSYLKPDYYLNDETDEMEYHYEGRWVTRKMTVCKDDFYKLKAFSIEWCLPTPRIYLNGSSSLLLLDNLFYTEGLILVHTGKFNKQYYFDSCIELFRKRVLSESNPTFDKPMPKFIQIIAMINENYEYLYNNGLDLLNYNYKDRLPFVTKKLPNKLYREMTQEEFMTYIDLSKSRTENTQMFIEKTKMSASMFNVYLKKFNIKFETRKPKKFNKNSNRFIQLIHHFDENGSLWTQHEQFIFDFICKNDYNQHLQLGDSGYGADYRDHYNEDADMYILDMTKDGKDWKIVKSIRDNRTIAKYKVTTESKKNYKELKEKIQNNSFPKRLTEDEMLLNAIKAQNAFNASLREIEKKNDKTITEENKTCQNAIKTHVEESKGGYLDDVMSFFNDFEKRDRTRMFEDDLESHRKK